MGFIELPLRRHQRLCVHSRLDRRPDIGPKPQRFGRVPFLPFLPASTVFSAEAPSEDGALDAARVCCTPQPAVGFALFRTLVRSFDRLGRRVFPPYGLFGAFLRGEYPSKLSPLR
jgi:hypothetical protein